MKGHKLELERWGLKPWLQYHPRCACGWSGQVVYSQQHARTVYREHLAEAKK